MAKRTLDIIGKTFTSKFNGNFTVISEGNAMRHGKRSFVCEFDEINGLKYKTERNITEIRGGNIKNPFKPSVSEIGYLGGVSCTTYKKEYTVWVDMIRRCYDKNRKDYKWYGGIGVKVCNEWHNFSNFVQDIQSIDGYDKELFEYNKLELDKDIFKTKEYSLSGCKFVSKEDNLKEMLDRVCKRYFLATNTKTKYSEKSNNTREFARKYNLSQSAISECLNENRNIHKGWIFEFFI